MREPDCIYPAAPQEPTMNLQEMIAHWYGVYARLYAIMKGGSE